MLIIYNPTDGEIFHVVKTSDIPTFTHTTNIELQSAEIPDEDDTLQEVRATLYYSHSKRNEEGQGRFYVDIQTNPPELAERPNWTEAE